MVKVKTRSAARKRFTKSGGKKGMIKRAKAFRRHLLTKKSSKTKRKLRKGSYINASDKRRIAILIG